MIRRKRLIWIVPLMWWSATAAYAQPAPQESSVDAEEVHLAEDLKLIELEPGLWRHVSTFVLVSRPTPANGLVLVSGSKALLIDTPWTEEQTDRLMDWIERDQGVTVAGVIVTHFHPDCMGGIGAVHRRGIPTYGLSLTADLARDDGNEPPATLFSESMELSVGAETVELYFPGPGHSHDNIVVWLESHRVLFGGCLIKNATTEHIGYLGNAEVDRWAASLERVRAQYPEARLIVPGHGQPGDWELVTNTLDLVARHLEDSDPDH